MRCMSKMYTFHGCCSLSKHSLPNFKCDLQYFKLMLLGFVRMPIWPDENDWERSWKAGEGEIRGPDSQIFFLNTKRKKSHCFV